MQCVIQFGQCFVIVIECKEERAKVAMGSGVSRADLGRLTKGSQCSVELALVLQREPKPGPGVFVPVILGDCFAKGHFRFTVMVLSVQEVAEAQTGWNEPWVRRNGPKVSGASTIHLATGFE